MTLFDRKVDLARFSETTPLYVMCRDWMRNKPQRRQPQINTPAAIAEVPPPSLSLPFSLLHSPKVVGWVHDVPKLMRTALAEVPPPSPSLPFSLLHSPKVVGWVHDVPKLMQNYPMILVPYKFVNNNKKSLRQQNLGVALPPRAVTRCIVDPALCTTSGFFVKRFTFFSWTYTMNLIISNPQVCNLEYTLYFFKFFNFFFTGN